MNFHFATSEDHTLLAELNHRLIRDEGHRNAMTVPELQQRMKNWLVSEYAAVIFEDDGKVVAYALYREEPDEIYLRQFFVLKSHRRRGIGKHAVELLRSRIWPATKRLTVDVLVKNEAAIAFWRAVGYKDYSLGLEILPAGLPVTEEIFDIVNERDEVIDRKPRSEVHRLDLLHRAVHVLVFNSRCEVFLQKRSMKKDRQPGVWDSSASGHVNSGEDYDASAVRELEEELGLRTAEPLQRLFKIPACAETDKEFVWIYRCERDGPFQLNADEIERGGWYSSDEVTRLLKERPQDFASAFRLIWHTFNS